MKIALKAEKTTDTCTHSTYSIHNCPSCKCNNRAFFHNVPSSPQYFHKMSDMRVRQNNLYNSNSSIPAILSPNGNIYVSKTTDYLPIANKSMNQLFRSSVF